MISSVSIEALLFAAGEPVEKKRLAALLGTKPERLTEALEELKNALRGRGLVLIESENELELRTAPEMSDYVKKLRESELTRDLGKAGLETLAVIAYHPQATRGEVDWVRGVNSSTSVRSLLLRGLIEGREDERDRRRMRYSITTEALAHIGAGSVKDLPRYSELAAEAKQAIKEEAVPEEASPQST